jgi:hypothetical protein
MKNEAEFKSLIKKSVIYCKGYCFSIAAPMISGLPDLYIVLPGYLPVLLEAKWLGEIKRESFSRKPQFTELQAHWIKSCDDVVPFSAMGLIGFKYKDVYTAALVKYGTPLFYAFSNIFLTDCSYVKYSQATKRFDMQQLFAGVPIPRIPSKHGEESINYGMAVS